MSIAVNQPKGTKNESNSQLAPVRYGLITSCKSTKGTKNESNSQLAANKMKERKCCKSTQRYKERKQFTTVTLTYNNESVL